MATLTELQGLFDDAAIKVKVEAACVIAAANVFADQDNFPTTTADSGLRAKRVAWASKVMLFPEEQARLAMRYVLGSSASATVAQINAANDATIQSKVNEAVDHMAEQVIVR